MNKRHYTVVVFYLNQYLDLNLCIRYHRRHMYQVLSKMYHRSFACAIAKVLLAFEPTQRPRHRQKVDKSMSACVSEYIMIYVLIFR